MQIKLAAETDLAMLQRLYEERIALLIQGDRRITPAPVQWLGRVDGCVWIGEVDDRVAGYVSVWWSDDVWTIDHMGLDAHSYHPGLGRALVSAVRDAARAQGASGVLVNVPSYDPVEQAFWRSVGAAKAGRRGSPGYQWMQFSL
jgi:GNAT superfamily N-acetyltransferase